MMCAEILAGEPEKIRTLAKGGFSGFQETVQIVVTNETQWAEVWKKHSVREKPAKPLPKVDFEKETVLVVSLGQKRSGGHSVEIAALEKTGDKTKVLLKTRAPKPGGIQIQAITAPYHIVAVPRIEGPVTFKSE
jgi:hypothetical protein